MKVYGVSVDPVADNKAFRDKFDFPFQLLSDEDRSMSLAFGAVADVSDQYAQRYTFVVGDGGIVEYSVDTKEPASQAEALLAGLRDGF